MVGTTCLIQDAIRAWSYRTFRSLQTRNYRLFFIGQVISRVGLWIQMVAENWLVIQLGGSGVMLGVTIALQFTPLLVFSAYAGALVDRWNTRFVLIVTQSAAGALALSLGLLALTGVIQIWMIWVAAFLLGCLNALDMPAREAFTMELAGPADVTNAVALNNVVRNAARTCGPALGGGLIAHVGIEACFLLNAASYMVVIAALCRMEGSALHTEDTVPHRRGQTWAGLQYVWGHPTLCPVLLMVAVATTFGLNFQVLVTLYTARTFDQGAALYGYLMSGLGIGAVFGSLMAASWVEPTVRRIAALCFAFGMANTAVAIAPSLLMGMLTLALMGMASSLFLTASAGYVQLQAGEQMRGRVMALYTLAYLGTAPLGGPLLGWVAQSLDVRAAFHLAGLGCMAASGLIFFTQRRAALVTYASRSA